MRTFLPGVLKRLTSVQADLNAEYFAWGSVRMAASNRWIQWKMSRRTSISTSISFPNHDLPQTAFSPPKRKKREMFALCNSILNNKNPITIHYMNIFCIPSVTTIQRYTFLSIKIVQRLITHKTNTWSISVEDNRPVSFKTKLVACLFHDFVSFYSLASQDCREHGLVFLSCDKIAESQASHRPTFPPPPLLPAFVHVHSTGPQ